MGMYVVMEMEVDNGLSGGGRQLPVFTFPIARDGRSCYGETSSVLDFGTTVFRDESLPQLQPYVTNRDIVSNNTFNLIAPSLSPVRLCRGAKHATKVGCLTYPSHAYTANHVISDNKRCHKTAIPNGSEVIGYTCVPVHSSNPP